MERFEPSKVMHPHANVENSYNPYWKTCAQSENHELIDPVTKRGIAIWDFHFNAPWFIGKGYLRINSQDATEFGFFFDPHFNPYPENRGKGKIPNLKHYFKFHVCLSIVHYLLSIFSYRGIYFSFCTPKRGGTVLNFSGFGDEFLAPAQNQRKIEF